MTFEFAVEREYINFRRHLTARDTTSESSFCSRRSITKNSSIWLRSQHLKKIFFSGLSALYLRYSSYQACHIKTDSCKISRTCGEKITDFYCGMRNVSRSNGKVY